MNTNPEIIPSVPPVQMENSLEATLLRAESVVREQSNLVRAIAETIKQQSALDAKRLTAERELSHLESDLAPSVNTRESLKTARSAFSELQARSNSLAHRLAGLRERLCQASIESDLKECHSSLVNSTEVRELADVAIVDAQTQISEHTTRLIQALARARGLELMTGRQFVQLPNLPPTHAAIRPDLTSLPDRLAHVNGVRDALNAALGAIAAERKRQRRELHSARVATNRAFVPTPGYIGQKVRLPEREPLPWVVG